MDYKLAIFPVPTIIYKTEKKFLENNTEILLF